MTTFPAHSGRFESLTAQTSLDFPEYAAPPSEPMELVQRWITDAVEARAREPRSLALATATTQGRASNRIVTFAELSPRGLVFTTHTSSRKARDLAATGWASALFYWREIGRQLALSGPVTELPDEESEALWAARPVPLHAMSVASRQSEPLSASAALRAEADHLAARGVALLRPDRFVGYLLVPDEVEFWSADPDRLHRRLRYGCDATGWRTDRLQP
ncbi:phenazine biosynthesis FMN-dependent oxidase PhzG [Streptomyces flavidovirens]|uniref:phenazine biosynthesis FMN-dependent oxidase PhzG n=1 Tax=Streptomyces flavidovirens TaxID=67298 RepID=UPI00344AC64A